jgi:hypothetical protein
MVFQNDYRYMLDVLANRRPTRLPVIDLISIPDYVPVEGYLAMIEAAHKIRESERNNHQE